LNKHFQNIEVVKVFWMEYFSHFVSKVVQVQCKVCTQIEGKNKLLIPKLDFFMEACMSSQGFGNYVKGIKKQALFLVNQHSCY